MTPTPDPNRGGKERELDALAREMYGDPKETIQNILDGGLSPEYEELMSLADDTGEDHPPDDDDTTTLEGEERQ